ncbi:DUF861 domain-containing protein [candidate division KSB1 bacterium]|nr:cupin domain-containing protein [candidate division KSB1 bacterium]RQW00413.1 MAG: DUF861 domain-containing protein [candidate division KSB1 bacterium]
MKIKVEKASDNKVDQLGVKSWPIWTKEVSEFPWYYDEKETCLILEGQVVVTPEGGEPVEINAGDLVEFPQGMHCRWKITRDIRKHYHFG